MDARLFYIVIFLWGSVSLFAQDGKKAIKHLSGQFLGGQIQVHSQKIEHFRGIKPRGAGIDFSWKFVSEKTYGLCQCYPFLGVSAVYWDFGHQSLGHGFSTLFYVEPVIFSPFNAEVSLKTGLGLSYLDNPFHETDNAQNITYSTHFAFPLMIGINISQPIDDNWSLLFSGIFQHISNGGTNQPNLGINYGTIGLGIRRKLDNKKLPAKPDLPPFEAKEGTRRFFLTTIGSLKEPVGKSTKAAVIGLSGTYERQFARMNAWSAGVVFEQDNSRDVSRAIDKTRVSLMGGHTFLLGRFSFAQKAGVYLHSGHPTHDPWFQYYTLDYQASEKLGIGVGLKAHGKVAEYTGLRLLYRVF